MKKSFDVKVGDKIIYRLGYLVKESEVVPKPIDDEKRPMFKIGRIDLANGDYLINGTVIYDSIEEAEQEILKDLDKDIEEVDKKLTFYQGTKKFLEIVKEDLLKKYKVED